MKARFYGVLGVALLMLVPAARAQLNLNPFAEYYNNIPRAAAANDVGKVRSLLSNGYSPNQLDETGQAGMHVAATNGNLQIAAILIKAGADINLRDKVGSTPLDDAAEHGRLEMLKLLLDVGATVDAEGYYWNAFNGTGAGHGDVRRYGPDGTLDRRIG